MDIRINGKTLLAVGLLSAGLAFGEYVSVISSDSLSYTSAVPETPVMTVGAVVLRMDDTNPSTIYGGTWELVTGDASLRFGDGTNLSGAIEGNGNNPIVPLPKHSHTKGTMNITGSFTNIAQDRSSAIGATGAFSKTSSGTGRGTGDGTAMDFSFNAANAWTGSTSEEGSNNANLDVRGDYIKINVWKRIN